MRFLRILRALIKPLTLERRAEVQVQLPDASTPDFDFFLLVALSSVIATLGLIIDSAAVILGATILARRREGEQLLLLCGQAIERGRVWAERSLPGPQLASGSTSARRNSYIFLMYTCRLQERPDDIIRLQRSFTK